VAAGSGACEAERGFATENEVSSISGGCSRAEGIGCTAVRWERGAEVADAADPIGSEEFKAEVASGGKANAAAARLVGAGACGVVEPKATASNGAAGTTRSYQSPR
jgi:hypothetical protein